MTVKNLALIALLVVAGIGGAWAARNAEVLRVGSAAEPVVRWIRSHTFSPVAFQTSAAPAAATTQSEAIRVNGSRPLLPQHLILSGQVTGVPAALRNSVAVTVHAGGRAYSTVMDGATYRVSLSGLSDEEMVRVEAHSQRIHYVSVIGSYGKLRQMAGEDRYLDPADHHRLRVSPYSSSLAWMIRVALGRDASNDMEFEATTHSIQYSDMIGAAHALYLVAYEFMALPSGFNDGWELLENESAFRTATAAYIDGNQVTETFEQDAIDAFFDQPDYAKFASLSDMPETTLLLGAVPMADIPVYVSISSTGAPFSDARLLVKNSDGTVSGYSSQGNGAVRFSARVSHDVETDGEIFLTPVDAMPEQVYSYTWFNPTRLERTVRQLQSTRWRRFFVGDRSSVWATSSRWTVSYPDSPEIGSETVYERRIASATDLEVQYLRNAWTGLSGRRALPWICASGTQLEVCEYAQYRFDSAGTGVVEDLGFKLDSRFAPVSGVGQDTLSWSVDAAGRLQARIRDSDITFWSLPGGNTAADSVIYLARGRTPATAGKAIFGQTLSLRVDPPAYALADVTGTWMPGATVLTAVRYPNLRPIFTIQRNLDGITRDEYFEYGQNVNSFIGTWQLFSQRSYDYRVRAFFPENAQWVTDCTTAFAAGATHCAPRRVRYFKPLKRVGDRIYGIEELYTYEGFLRPPGDTEPFEIVRDISRPNFHSCVSATCAATVPMAPQGARKPLQSVANAARLRTYRYSR